jgi:hypothetical protein
MPDLPSFGNLVTVRPEVLDPERLIDMVDLGHLAAKPAEKGKRRKLGQQAPAAQVIQDARAFFHITFPTHEVVETLRVLSKRLTSPTEVPGTLLLSGRYGLGKSHILLAAHHALTNPAAAREWAHRWNLPAFDVPDDLIVITRSFIHRGKENLWQVVLEQLDGSQVFEGDFPDGETLERLIGDRRVVLIFDEIERWFDGQAAIRGGRNRNFLQALTETTTRSGNLTLLTSVLGEKAEPAETLRRVRPLELSFRSADDRQRVILFRMFEGRDEPAVKLAIARLVDDYTQAYSAAQISDVDAYTSRMSETWPFTPEFLDILTKKVPNLGGFQSTRGTLRFLAEVVRHTHQTRPVVSSQDLPLKDDRVSVALQNLDQSGEAVRRALGDNYDAVPADLPHKDELFSTILFYSIADPTNPGATREDIMRAVMDPGENPNRIRDSLERLRSLAFHLHVENDRFVFRAQENPHARINAVASSQLVTNEACAEVIESVLLQKWGDDKATAVHRPLTQARTEEHLKAAGKRRPKVILSLCSLSPRQRLSAQNLDERRNTVLLLEPSVSRPADAPAYDLLADDDLRRIARRIEACNRLLENSPDRDAAAIYRDVRAKAQTTLGKEVAARYGRYVAWHRAGASTETPDQGWYELARLDDFSHASLLALVRRDWSSPPEFVHRIGKIWTDYRHRPVQALVDQFDRTPGLPVPYDAGLVPDALRALVKTRTLGLSRPGGEHVGPSTIGQLSQDDILACTLVDARAELTTPPPPDKHAHTFVTATWEPSTKGVRVAWTFPELPPHQGTLRTVIQRYTSTKGWKVGEVHRIDIDASHGANRYLGSDTEFVDTNNLTPGVGYHYYVFCVHDRPDGTSQAVLSQRCDVLVPKDEPDRPNDELSFGPVSARNRLLMEVEKTVMNPRKLPRETTFRKVTFTVQQVRGHAALTDFLDAYAGKADKLDAAMDLHLALRGTFDRQQVLDLVRRLPKVDQSLYTAVLHVRTDTEG